MASRYMHRRIDVSGGFSADADWAGTHTLPNLAPDDAVISAGGIAAFTAHKGAALIWVEARTGMGDDADVVAPGSLTWSGEVVSWYNDEGDNVFAVGEAATNVPGQKRQIEDELGTAPSLVRLTAASNIPVTADALWVYVDTSVRR